jgi:hypothetical protein
MIFIMKKCLGYANYGAKNPGLAASIAGAIAFHATGLPICAV